MSENSKIEWTDATFNPWIGCTKVSPACDHCYAEVSTPARALAVAWGPKAERRRTAPANWKLPERWNRGHDEFFAQHGRRRRVFCASLSDVFDNQVPATWRADLFQLIERTPNLDWLLLTKRIGNVPAMMLEVAQHLFWMDHLDTPRLPANVWLGATICDQVEADRDIPKLLEVPARVHFLSMEPLLGPVDICDYLEPGYPNCQGFEQGSQMEPGYCGDCGGHVSDPIHDPMKRDAVDWVIVGGESGTQARPMHPDWTRSLRDQCASASVPFLFKQWGEWAPRDPLDWDGQGARLVFHKNGTAYVREGRNLADAIIDTSVRGSAEMHRLGKKAAGRLLDGVHHDGFPRLALANRDASSPQEPPPPLRRG